MDLAKIVHGMEEQQPLAPAPQATTNPAPSNLASPQAPIAAANTNIPVTDACNAMHSPTQDDTNHELPPDSLSSLQPPPPSACPDSGIFTDLIDASSADNIPAENGNSDAEISEVKQALRTAVSLYESLEDGQKTLIRHDLDVQQQLRQMGFDPNSKGFLGHGSPQKRKHSTHGLTRSENGSEATDLPTKMRSRQASSRDSSGTLEKIPSQNSITRDRRITISIEDLRIVCQSPNKGKATSLEQSAINFCERIANLDFCIAIEKFAKKSSSHPRNYASSLKNPPFARDKSINHVFERNEAIKELIEKLGLYGGSIKRPPCFYRTWDLLSLADLIAPDYDAYCEDEQNKKAKPLNFEWWSHRRWWKVWNTTCEQNGWPAIDALFGGERAKDMQEGMYWREWCRSLSDNQSDIHHRGALLLLLAASRVRLKDDTFSLAEEYITETFPWVKEIAKIVDSWAFQLYATGIDKEQRRELKGDLRSFGKQTAGDALEEELSSTSDEAEDFV
ncbi:hypothetical protein N431DRAFT_482306 [Stipitochalara longipes BDJ]|nr:hypothetical protein N431DRAFT_482306 [Stipitochalara longipes BDJ]